MSRIMTIWLPRWPVQRRLLEQPELRRRPVFVCRRERRGVMVVVSWAWAGLALVDSRQGVGPQPLPRPLIRSGMSLAEAMAVLALSCGSGACHLAHVDHDDPVADRSALETLARWCHRFSPVVAVGDGMGPSQEGLQLDIAGTAGFFGGEGPLARTAVWTLAARGLHARVAVADTPAASRVASRHTDFLTRENGIRQDTIRGRWPMRHSRVAVVPPGGQAAALAGLPAASLQLTLPELASLHDVGIETIGQLLRLPRGSLASRFDPSMSQRIAAFLGERAEPLLPPCSTELPCASHRFELPLQLRDISEQAVIEIIRQLVGRCVAALTADAKGVMALQVRFECERLSAADAIGRSAGRPPTVLDVGLFRPSAAVSHLVDLVRLRMARTRLPEEIDLLAVEVVAAGAVACRQQRLFGKAAEADAREVEGLMDRLAGRLGRQAIFEPRLLADPQPELGWVAMPVGCPQAATAVAGPRLFPRGWQHRPAWLLPRPQRLETLSVAPDGPPMRFLWRGGQYAIQRFAGPERIETAWWRGGMVRRDYYVVETTSGRRFWLFRRLRDRAWFLHGVFA